jgi:hypothetical protein
MDRATIGIMTASLVTGSSIVMMIPGADLFGVSLLTYRGGERLKLWQRQAISHKLSVGQETRRRPMQTAKWAARIGAVFYVFWGIFHLVAANAVYALAEQSTGMVRARLLQDAFYLLFFAIAGILMAAILNWRNDKQGYWMNGTLIAFADIPFVLFVLVPGLIPWWPGLAGPLLWLAAFVFTTVSRFSPESKVMAGAHA